MANPSMAAGGGVPLAEGVRAVRAQIRNRFRVAPVDRVAVALAAASQSLRNREILDAVGTTAAALSTTDADGVQQGGQAAAADRRVVRAACGRRQAAAADRDGGGGLLARLLQRLRPLLLPRHRLQVCGDGLRSQGKRPLLRPPLLPRYLLCYSVCYFIVLVLYVVKFLVIPSRDIG
ncbi:hypothetical protein VPH35_036599 [Triticum aestivum]